MLTLAPAKVPLVYRWIVREFPGAAEEIIDVGECLGSDTALHLDPRTHVQLDSQADRALPSDHAALRQVVVGVVVGDEDGTQ
jgi:hypothetical protein